METQSGLDTKSNTDETDKYHSTSPYSLNHTPVPTLQEKKKKVCGCGVWVCGVWCVCVVCVLCGVCVVCVMLCVLCCVCGVWVCCIMCVVCGVVVGGGGDGVHENAIFSVSANDAPNFCTSRSVSSSTRKCRGQSTLPNRRGSRR